MKVLLNACAGVLLALWIIGAVQPNASVIITAITIWLVANFVIAALSTKIRKSTIKTALDQIDKSSDIDCEDGFEVLTALITALYITGS